MKFSKYLIDKFLSILIASFSYFVILFLLLAFRIDMALIVGITFVFLLMCSLLLMINYFRKKKFYDELCGNVESLDKKYLILETISKPNFYEGQLLYQNLYEIDKSMTENVRNRQREVIDFKEYVEMWIHEVKIPISSLMLFSHNHPDKFSKKYLEQVRKLDNYVDQVLYYVRSNYTEEDFVIKKVQLEKIIGNVLMKNKDDLLENKIDLEVNLNGLEVYTDSKWLEFILNQIINNSVKYKNDFLNSFVKIEAILQDDKTILSIYDNGIGIPKKDLKNVFKKSFTGENGRTKTKSTGMGLYIADKLCKKMGHVLEVYSLEGEWTELRIVFGNNDFYKVEK